MVRRFRGLRVGVCCLVWVALALFCRTAWGAKNIIIMISDGAGCNTWLATSMYQGKVGKQAYDQADWQHYLVSTFPLNTSPKPTHDGRQDPALVYEPSKYWDSAIPDLAADSARCPFAGYLFATRAATDSSAAASAMSTGKKTFNHSVNWSNDGAALRGQTIAELAKASGRSVGAITTVLVSDATPVGLGGAHNANRSAYSELANELLNAPSLDVLMGAGHPDFDDDGERLPVKTPEAQWAYLGGEKTWELLKSGKHPAGWHLIETKADFENLPKLSPPPKRLLGIPQVASAIQCNRSNGRREQGKNHVKPVLSGGRGLAEVNNDKSLQPFETPLNPNVPSLATMARGALHCLETNPNGLFLMIEGGAVDWANHVNNPGRMIEEHIDFLNAVDAVVQWVDTHGGWEETLLILTADHETGMLWGPQADKVPFQPLVDRGPGKLPGLRFLSNNHTNSLTPLHARGAGSERFRDLIRGIDPTAAKVWGGSGQFIDNTDIFTAMRDAALETADSAVSP